MEISSISQQAYTRISSGMRINSASDDAAGLSIAQGMSSETRAMEKNVENMGAMTDLTNTADGALGNMQDSLGRIRELAVSASNGILSNDDRSIIQSEINQLMEGISSVAKNTEFNTIKLLDGSFTDKATSMTPDGSGKRISIASATLENLGIDGFDVTKPFDLEAIDNAIGMVSESRSSIGSINNAFKHATNNVMNGMANLTSAKSQIEDADMVQEITNMKKEQILQQYQIYAQKAKEDQQRTELGPIQEFRV